MPTWRRHGASLGLAVPVQRLRRLLTIDRDLGLGRDLDRDADIGRDVGRDTDLDLDVGLDIDLDRDRDIDRDKGRDTDRDIDIDIQGRRSEKLPVSDGAQNRTMLEARYCLIVAALFAGSSV